MSTNPIKLDVKPDPKDASNDIITWAPVTGAGVFRLKAGGKWVSSTFDGSKTSWKVKRAKTYELVAYGGLTAEGVYPEIPSVGEIPIFNATITPNWCQPSEVGINYNCMWAIAHSPSTPWRSPDSNRTNQQRYLLLDPRAKDADGIPGWDDWWFIIERAWPQSYNQDQHGAWGRKCNFHNVAGDSGPDGGVGWNWGNGSSSFALDWLPGDSAPSFCLEYLDGGKPKFMSSPVRGEVQTYLVHFVAGRTDGTTARPGACTIWDNGTKKYDFQGINTLQKAKGPDGVDYVQRWMQLWEGDYTKDLQVVAPNTVVLTRIGRTFAEAVADRPYKTSSIGENSIYRGSGSNLGAPSLVSAGMWDVANSRLPAV